MMNEEDLKEQLGLNEPLPEDEGIHKILTGVLTGWDSLAVRVRQDGKRRFILLKEVKDKQLQYKIVMDLIKQLARGEGLR